MADILDSMNGWNPLILCLMYESQRGDSFWKSYFGKYICKKCLGTQSSAFLLALTQHLTDVLPTEFSTPMFWSNDDLKELEGTDVVDKIGKEDAEAMFKQELEPVIKVKKRKKTKSRQMCKEDAKSHSLHALVRY